MKYVYKLVIIVSNKIMYGWINWYLKGIVFF